MASVKPNIKSQAALVATLVATAVVAAAGTGCGPVRYASQVTSRATAEIAGAETARADDAAPYEITKARAYLHKAREEAGESRWERALDYGRKAEDAARDARRKAGDDASPPAVTPAGGKGRDPFDDSPDDEAPAVPAGKKGVDQ